MKQVKRIFIGTLFLFCLIGCSKSVDKPNDENEHESINKIELLFSESGGATKTFAIEDADGDGGKPPSRIDISEDLVLASKSGSKVIDQAQDDRLKQI